jgi:uncharacterized protein (DUF427 family)
VRVGDWIAENAVWSYLEPNDSAAWLRGYQSFFFDAMDAWFDEDEEIAGNLRDPYHRVDVRDSSRRVRVLADGQVVAETDRPRLLSETGVPNRYYIPPDDVRRDLLEPSATHSVCPYKGTASYHTLRVGGQRLPDVAWFYPAPLESAVKVRAISASPARGSTSRSTASSPNGSAHLTDRVQPLAGTALGGLWLIRPIVAGQQLLYHVNGRGRPRGSPRRPRG